jgi:hypothetical protein
VFSDDVFPDSTVGAVAIRNDSACTKVTTMDTMTLDMPTDIAPATGLELTLEETLVLQSLWLNAERVDWAVYESLRRRVLAWTAPAPAATGGRNA